MERRKRGMLQVVSLFALCGTLVAGCPIEPKIGFEPTKEAGGLERVGTEFGSVVAEREEKESIVQVRDASSPNDKSPADTPGQSNEPGTTEPGRPDVPSRDAGARDAGIEDSGAPDKIAYGRKYQSATELRKAQSAPVDKYGIVSRSTGPMPAGLPTSCEVDGHDRFTGDAFAAATPMRKYFAVCRTNTNAPKMYISVTLVDDRPRKVEKDPAKESPDRVKIIKPRVGSIIEMVYDPATRSMVRTGNDVVLDQCDESHGIAVSQDCSRVAVLCQRYDHASKTETATKDLTTTHKSSSRIKWITQPDNVALVDNNKNISADKKKSNYRYNGEMWLLEWNNQKLVEKPDAYVLHKAISGSHLGNHTLVYAEKEDTYGASMFAAVFDQGGGRHSGDIFQVVNRKGWTLDNDRGWRWQCGRGHTLHNRGVYHEETKQYYGICTTDLRGYRRDPAGAGFFVKAETQSHLTGGWEFHAGYTYFSRANGGTHAFIPIQKGFIGTVVATPTTPDDMKAPAGYLEKFPLQIGLVTLGKEESGKIEMRRLKEPIRWIAANKGAFLGSPQLAKIGTNRYLFGYGELHRIADAKNNRNTHYDFTIPWKYYMQEIDGKGKALTSITQIAGIGWGEQDQMISLGKGRVAWVYIDKPELIERKKAPACSRTVLQVHVYHAKNP